MNHTQNDSPRFARRLLVALALLTAIGFTMTALPAPVEADDRKLITGFEEIPYVFILFDTSGSMNRRTDQSSPLAAQDADDSKLVIAKRALYNVLGASEDIRFGFNTFSQDSVRASRKHWVYELDTTPTWNASVPYPEVGGQYLFGGAGFGPGCGAESELSVIGEDLKFLPQVEDDTFADPIWFLVSGVRYRIDVSTESGSSFGDPTIDVRLRLRRADGEDCGSITYTELGNEVHTYSFVQETMQVTETQPWDAEVGNDISVSNSCTGWEDNDDSSNDDYSGYNLKWSTMTAPAPYTPEMDLGDRIPFDWGVWSDSENVNRIQERLAPNILLGETTPDFTVARYLNDDRLSSQSYLRLKNEIARPIVAKGLTPLGRTLHDFDNWYGDWEALATTHDPEFVCKNIYVLLITDGLDTCEADDGSRETVPPARAKALWDDHAIRTFVVAFSVAGAPGGPNPVTVMDNIAREGQTCEYDDMGNETRCAFFPTDEAQLVAAISSIFQAVSAEQAAFSAAAVPSVQAGSADMIFLSEFTPVDDNAIWPGRMNAFVRPLPLDDDNRPDTSVTCSGADDSACLAWNSASSVYTNQVLPSLADPVGLGPSQRRVYYSHFPRDPISGDPVTGGVPRDLRLFEKTTAPEAGSPTAEEAYDLWRGMNIDFLEGLHDGICDPEDPTDAPCLPLSEEAAHELATETIAETLAPKVGTRVDGTVLNYILGDNFHSDPLFLSSPPSNFNFIADLNGYREFFFEHQRRRRMLLMGGNDGMLHVHEAGTFRTSGSFKDRFDFGSGRELMAYIPRPVLPLVKGATLDIKHEYKVDGSPVAMDAYIDPIHDGPTSVTNPPDADDREWRTIAIGGLRRGGDSLIDISDLSGPASMKLQVSSGYYALDVTQPDPVDTSGDPPYTPNVTNDAVPGCFSSSGSTSPPGGCGPVAFGTPLWEFTDSILGYRLNEDGNVTGLNVDLAEAWSEPMTGRIQVCTQACNGASPVLEDRYVAIFGGGLDPTNLHVRGNWLYILDVETGRALYKQPVIGSVPGQPAAIDSDFDGYLDRIYFGTTIGLVYRVDLVGVDTSGDIFYPELESVNVEATTETGGTVQETHLRITSNLFEPKVIFNATDEDDSSDIDPTNPGLLTVDYPIYMRPSVIFVQELGLYAIAGGTGNREDLFDRTEPEGRFFVFLDDFSYDDLYNLDLELDFDALTDINPDGASIGFGTSLLLGRSAGQSGWRMSFETNERLVTMPFALSGVLIYSTFEPSAGPQIDGDSLCRESGDGRAFAVLSTNANGLFGSSQDRYVGTETLAASVIVEQRQSQNKPPPAGRKTKSGTTPDQALILKQLKALMPENCTFVDGYGTDISLQSIDSEFESDPIPVPQCVIETNFREF